MHDDILHHFAAPGDIRSADSSFFDFARNFYRQKVCAGLMDWRKHPLGFLHASEKISREANLRLHFWPIGWVMPQTEIGAEIHDHNYELNSLVITGELRHETFEESICSSGVFLEHEVKYKAGNSSLISTGNIVTIVQDQNSIHGVGIFYRLAPGRMHRVTPLVLPAATLVVTKVAARGRDSRVLVRRGHKLESHSFERDPVSPLDKQIIFDFFDALR